MTSDQTKEKSVISQAIDAYWEVVQSDEFKELERLRERARHNEAAALHHARTEGEKQEREKWQGIVAEKDRLIAELRTELDSKGS